MVTDGALAIQNGRAFVAYKLPGSRRNTLFELSLATFATTPIGLTPGPYFIEGGCSLSFDQAGQLLMLNFCSTDPTTGGAGRPVLWETGIIVGGVAGGTSDGLVRTCLRALRAAVASALAPLG